MDTRDRYRRLMLRLLAATAAGATIGGAVVAVAADQGRALTEAPPQARPVAERIAALRSAVAHARLGVIRVSDSHHDSAPEHDSHHDSFHDKFHDSHPS